MRQPPGGEPLIPELESFHRQFDAIKAEVTDLTAGLTETQWNWRPAAGSWSIAECLDHLNIFGRDSQATMYGMIEQARTRGFFSRGPFRGTLLGTLLIWLIEPPYRIRFKAVKSLVPGSAHRSRDVLSTFLALQGELQDLLAAANGIDLGGVKAALPTRPRVTLGEWIAVVAAHERRHLWQARQIRSLADFPKA